MTLLRTSDTDLSLFRVYEPFECGSDGYPKAWHRIACPRDTDGDGDCGRRGCPYCGGDGSVRAGIKDLVREQAGHRCVRCLHPYRAGCGEWGEEEGNPEGPPSGLLSLLERDDYFDDDRRAWQERSRPPLWSPCDERCRHGGPIRWFDSDFGDWHVTDEPPEMRGYFAVQQAAWRILTVHHANGRKEDCRWWNLLSLCQRCHLEIQGKVQMERVWPWEHSEWFKPYAAGWYAYAYLGESLTRTQTMQRLEELLALEQVATLRPSGAAT